MIRLALAILILALLAYAPAEAQFSVPPFKAAGGGPPASCAPYRIYGAPPYENFATPPYRTGC